MFMKLRCNFRILIRKQNVDVCNISGRSALLVFFFFSLFLPILSQYQHNLGFWLEKVQGATRLEATRLRASEREICL